MILLEKTPLPNSERGFGASNEGGEESTVCLVTVFCLRAV